MSTRKRATRAGALTLAVASAFALAASTAASTVTSAGIHGSGKSVQDVVVCGRHDGGEHHRGIGTGEHFRDGTRGRLADRPRASRRRRSRIRRRRRHSAGAYGP